MSTTSTSSTTEKVNGTALADIGDEREGKGDVEQGKEQIETPDDVGEYPSGFRLAMVVLALVLAVFLVALDLVSRTYLQPRFFSANYDQDNRCYCYTSNHGPIPQLGSNRVVWIRILPNVSFVPVHLGQSIQVLSHQDIIHDCNCDLRTR
jgi:hypothetical protein